MSADPNDPHVSLVVEGRGDVGAVPVLLRAYLQSEYDYRDILGKPIPVHGRSNALVQSGLEGFVATAASRPGSVGVLVLLDSEGDCIKALGPELLDRAAAATGKPVRVALADKDFEDWLYSSAETLELDNLPPFDSEKRGQKVIKASLRPATYAKPVWQPRLAARMDLTLARSRSRSLDRMLNRFDELRILVPSDEAD